MKNITTTNPNPNASRHAGRRTYKIITVLTALVLITALLAGLHLALERHCTALTQSRVLPWLKARYQTDIQLDHISVNLLTGVLLVEGLAIGNPPGFETAEMARLPYFRLRLALHDLWRKNTFTIRSLRVKDARFNLVRNRNGELNLAGPAATPASDGMPDPGQPDRTDQPAGVKTDPAPDKAPPHLTLDKARIHARIAYTDHNPIFQPQPLAMELDMNLLVHHLANHGRADQLTGTVLMDGAIIAGQTQTPLELRGRIAPITSPRQLTFELTGATRTFNLMDTPALADWLGLEQGKVACVITLDATQSVIDPAKSVLKFNFSDIQFNPEARRRFQGIPLPRTFTMELPVSGTLESPQVDFAAAVARLLTSDDAIRSLLQDVLR